MTINLVHEAMGKARADVGAASARLADERARADRRVTGLLGSGWTGIAADSFSGAWEDWNRAADEVRDGLDAIRQQLGVVHRDLAAQDQAARVSFDRLARRVADRLG